MNNYTGKEQNTILIIIVQSYVAVSTVAGYESFTGY